MSRWWHGWGPQDFDELAGGLIAGHLTECSAFITGILTLPKLYRTLILLKVVTTADSKI